MDFTKKTVDLQNHQNITMSEKSLKRNKILKETKEMIQQRAIKYTNKINSIRRSSNTSTNNDENKIIEKNLRSITERSNKILS